MKIIAYKGFWREASEKNTLDAFLRAWETGYGVETDIRDYNGELVVSHDPAMKGAITIDEFLDKYKAKGKKSILALNIKADGLSDMMYKKIQEYSLSNYFVFDMSIPEMVLYREKRMKYLTRQSDIENECVLYRKADGVWMDSYMGYEWMNKKVIQKHLDAAKKAVIVSPDLHREYNTKVWEMLKGPGPAMDEHLYLCTGYPEEAEQFFKKALVE